MITPGFSSEVRIPHAAHRPTGARRLSVVEDVSRQPASTGLYWHISEGCDDAYQPSPENL